MAAALERIARFANVDVIVTIGRRPGLSAAVREGYPSDHLPALSGSDTVYACGPSHLIDAVTPAVVESGAQFYCDPFEPAPQAAENPLLEGAKRLKRLLTPERLGFTLPGALAGLGTEA
jgi:hypothetical protein